MRISDKELMVMKEQIHDASHWVHSDADSIHHRVRADTIRLLLELERYKAALERICEEHYCQVSDTHGFVCPTCIANEALTNEPNNEDITDPSPSGG